MVLNVLLLIEPSMCSNTYYVYMCCRVDDLLQKHDPKKIWGSGGESRTDDNIKCMVR